MLRANRTNPYNGFKDDRERRRALNVRAVCWAVVAVALPTSNVLDRCAEAVHRLVTLMR